MNSIVDKIFDRPGGAVGLVLMVIGTAIHSQYLLGMGFGLLIGYLWGRSDANA